MVMPQYLSHTSYVDAYFDSANEKLSKIVNVETVTNVVDGRHLENAKESEIEYELSEFLKHVPHIVKGDNHSAT